MKVVSGNEQPSISQPLNQLRFSAGHCHLNSLHLRLWAHLLGVPPLTLSQESQASGEENQCPLVWTKVPTAMETLWHHVNHTVFLVSFPLLQNQCSKGDEMTSLLYFFNAGGETLQAAGNWADIPEVGFKDGAITGAACRKYLV